MGGILKIGPQGQFGGCKAAVRQWFCVAPNCNNNLLAIWMFFIWVGTDLLCYILSYSFWFSDWAMRLDFGTTHAEEIKLGLLPLWNAYMVTKVNLRATFDPNLPFTSVKVQIWLLGNSGVEKALSKWGQQEPADSDLPGIQRIYLSQKDPLALQKLMYSL